MKYKLSPVGPNLRYTVVINVSLVNYPLRQNELTSILWNRNFHTHNLFYPF